MPEVIDEQVSVNLLSSRPMSMLWRERQYIIIKVGLHHTTREGRTLLHIFSVTDGTTSFKLELNSETLSWKLLEIDSLP